MFFLEMILFSEFPLTYLEKKWKEDVLKNKEGIPGGSLFPSKIASVPMSPQFFLMCSLLNTSADELPPTINVNV